MTGFHYPLTRAVNSASGNRALLLANAAMSLSFNRTKCNFVRFFVAYTVEVMFLPRLVGLLAGLLGKLWMDFRGIFWKGTGLATRKNRFDFVGNLESTTGESIKLQFTAHHNLAF